MIGGWLVDDWWMIGLFSYRWFGWTYWEVLSRFWGSIPCCVDRSFSKSMVNLPRESWSTSHLYSDIVVKIHHLFVTIRQIPGQKPFFWSWGLQLLRSPGTSRFWRSLKHHPPGHQWRVGGVLGGAERWPVTPGCLMMNHMIWADLTLITCIILRLILMMAVRDFLLGSEQQVDL